MTLWSLTFESGRTPTVGGVDGYSISQVAERTGFPPTTLRFYEQSGLLSPPRTESGYRRYDDTHIELLSFVGRAKGFGLSLDEITELLALLGDDECAPVQDLLRDLVEAKIADAEAKLAELEAFAARLRRVAASLGVRTPAGPCDDTCGCTTDNNRLRPPPVPFADRPDGPAIACTLSSHQVGDRLARWEATAARAITSEAIDGGTRLTFGRDVDLVGLAELVAAEQDCCRFFTFTLGIAAGGVALDVNGPADALPVIDRLIGTAR